MKPFTFKLAAYDSLSNHASTTEKEIKDLITINWPT